MVRIVDEFVKLNLSAPYISTLGIPNSTNDADLLDNLQTNLRTNLQCNTIQPITNNVQDNTSPPNNDYSPNNTQYSPNNTQYSPNYDQQQNTPTNNDYDTQIGFNPQNSFMDNVNNDPILTTVIFNNLNGAPLNGCNGSGDFHLDIIDINAVENRWTEA
jgi:hypothetical protein